MDTPSKIILGIILFCFAIVMAMTIFTDFEDLPKLVNRLKKEDKIIFPIGISMLAYQIYKSGSWEFSSVNYNYIVIFFYVENVLMILLYKFMGEKMYNRGGYLSYLCLNIVFTPLITIGFLIMTILGMK